MIWQGSENIRIESKFQIFHVEMKKIKIETTKWLFKSYWKKGEKHEDFWNHYYMLLLWCQSFI